MKLRRVDPQKIRIPEVRVTARMDEETAHQFEESVATAGIDEPIKVYEVDGELILSDGMHRLMEAIKLKLPLVDVYVRPGTMQDVLCNNLMSGHLRGKHPVSEMVRSIEALGKEYQMDSEMIAKKTGLTRDYVENLMLISQLTPMIRAALDEGVIKVGHALALTRIKDPVQQEMVYHQLAMYRWGVKETDSYVSSVLAIVLPEVKVQEQAPRPPATTVRCAFCGLDYELANIANPNTCSGCAGIMLASIAQARAEASGLGGKVAGEARGQRDGNDGDEATP